MIKLNIKQLNYKNSINWEWTKNIDYKYIPPLLRPSTLVENTHKSFMNTIPGSFPISDEEFLQHFCGFMDAEGLLYFLPKKNKIFWKIRLSTHIDDLAYLLKVRERLGIGSINKIGLNLIAWEVQNHKDIINILIPLFDKYPFISAKAINYKYFKEACLYKYEKAHNRSLTLEEENYFNDLKNETKSQFIS